MAFDFTTVAAVTIDSDLRIHVRFLQDVRTHDLESADCSCGPQLVRSATYCDECKGGDPDCWKCGGTWRDVTPAEAAISPCGLLVLHVDDAFLAQLVDEMTQPDPSRSDSPS